MREPTTRGRYYEDFGILVEDCRLVNQRKETVLTGEHVLMIRRRPTTTEGAPGEEEEEPS